jgi:hypothetical protein
MRGYRPKHFDLRELVTPEIYMTRGQSAWELLDSRGLIVLDALREKFGPVTVNDWHLSGSYSESGLRSLTTQTGARYSQHKMGRAFDTKYKDVKPQEVYDYLLAHADEFPELTVVEDIAATPTWVHVDVRNADWKGVRIVKP